MNALVKNDEVVLTYADSFIKDTREDLQEVSKAFFRIGFRLNEAVANNYVEALGYNDIYQLAEAEFGFKSTMTKTLMAINTKFSSMPGQRTFWIKEKYKDFNQSQLQEMLPLEERELENIKPSMTVKDIRDYKKAIRQIDDIGLYPKIANPELAVEQYREKQSQAEVGQTSDRNNKDNNTVAALDVAPGQIEFDEEIYGTEVFALNPEAEETPLSEVSKFPPIDLDEAEESEEEFESVINSKVLSDERVSTEPATANICFSSLVGKDRQRIEDFIIKEDNYPILVLSNQEIGLTVKRIDFANGAKLYYAKFIERSYQSKEDFIGYATFHLVDELDRRPCSMYYNDIRKYTLTATPFTYIVDYILTFYDEI